MSSEETLGHEPMPEGEEPPPRGVQAMGVVRWIILGIAAMAAIFMWASYARDRVSAPSSAAEAPVYRCPMHPQVVSHEPGECPICHMDLVLVREGSASAAAVSSKAPVIVDDAGPLTYGCPMDAEVRSAKPGRCPVCKMALELLPDDAGSLTQPEPASTLEPGTTPPGTADFQLTIDRIQSVGVRTALAEESHGPSVLRVTAIVEAPEQGAAEVHVRAPGFVEAMHVAQTGVEVRAGQSLLSLYSPEILQAQHELLATRTWTDASVGSNAAENKLALLGVSRAETDRILAQRAPVRAVSVVAPRSGFVTKKNVVLGSYVTPEMVLYEIQDLSRVYVIADVFLRDAEQVKVGTVARFVPNGRPSDAAKGAIDLLYPLVNAEARTRRVRMQVPNAGARTYAPGQYGVVEIETGPRRAVTIPRDALVDTGTATYVFVSLDQGRFSPRVVATAGSEGDRVVIGAGLSAGERVVSGATFLIDSESRLIASITRAGSTLPSTSSTPSTSPPSAGAAGPSCASDFDRAKHPEKFEACAKCELVHRGMGAMEADCKRAIAKPWK